MGNSECSVKDEEELSVQIYEVVHKLYPENSEKITGMLLESDHEELSVLLNGNHEELRKRIKLAADVVQESKLDVSNETVITEDEESIGNKIYGTVHQLYPTYAGNITGMLLEMDKEQLVCLINDTDKLLRCIHQAAHVYMESQTEKKQISTEDREQNSTQPVPKNHNNHDTQSLDEGQEKELLGEQLYLKIESTHPNEAAKVTGMLLEMDVQSLKQVLDNSALLNKTIEEALEVLHNVEKGKNGIFIDFSEQEIKDKSISQIDSKTRKSSMDHERDELVEQLYHKIVAKHPTKAYKITGMFLEMDTNYLKQLNANSEFFDKKITECLKVME